jgi:hypothetical protein
MSESYADEDADSEDESFFRKYFKAWSFRSATPSFEPGDEIEVFVTGVRDGVHVARIGDTVIRVPDAPAGLVDSRVRLRITEFDDGAHEGTAEFLEKVGESAF